MNDRKPPAMMDLPMPWLGKPGAPHPIEDAGRRAFAAFSQASAIATETAQSVLAKQQRIVEGEFRRFIERMHAMSGSQPGADTFEKEARAIQESMQTTTVELRAINEIILNGNRKMLELWMSAFKPDGEKK